MKTKLEKNAVVFDYLEAFSTGYSTGDFSAAVSHLAEDCVMESQWVLTPNVGRKVIEDYYTGKGETLRRNGALATCSIVEIFSTPACHLRDEGELCLLIEQEHTGIQIILRICLTDDDRIIRIDLCDPELFSYRFFYTYVEVVPSCECAEDHGPEGRIYVSEAYYSELYLFLGMAGIDFDEYDTLPIPMIQWKEAMEHWRRFCSFHSFDQALEDACGIDYASFTVRDRKALQRLSKNGDEIWKNRHQNQPMLSALIEWTEKYAESCDTIYSYGF